MMNNFDDILLELGYRVPEGIVDLTKDYQVKELVNILKENGYSDANELAQKARVYFSYLKEVEEVNKKNNPYDNDTIKYKDDKGRDKEILVKTALSYKDDKRPGPQSAYRAALTYVDKKKKGTDVGAGKSKKGTPPKADIGLTGAEKAQQKKQTTQQPEPVKDDKNKAAKVANALYGKGKRGAVMGDAKTGDNQVKNDMLKYGFKGYQKATGKKPAPGSEGSAFNEIISGEGAKILEKSPDLSDIELTRVLVNQFCGTALGKEQTDSKDVIKDLPNDLKSNKCASKALIAARSARDKFDRANQTKQELQSKGLLSKNSKIETFYGADASKAAQIEMVKNAKRVMMPDGTVVDKGDAIAFVAAGGGGANPSDTGVFIQDDKGNVVIKFYSDKTSTGDIQDNSTLAQEINDKLTQVDALEKNKVLTKQQAQRARTIIANHAKNISKIEDSYSEGNTIVAGNLMKGGKGYSDKEQLALLTSGKNNLDKNFKEATTDKKGYKKEIIQNLPKGCNPNKPTTACLYASLRKVVADGKGSVAQQKVIMKISGMLTSNFINAGKEVPDGIDVNSIVSVQRKKVAESYHKMFRDLDGIVVKVGNTKKGLGTLSQSEDVIDSFHLSLMDYPPKKYKKGDMHSMMGQSFEMSMGGDMVNGEMLRNCMGVKNTQEFKEKFSVKETQEFTYEFSEKEAIQKLKSAGITNPTKKQLQNARNVTGMKIFSYAIDKKTGQSQEVGFRTYRGKAGKTSKTSTTMQYSDGMRKCFAEKNKKK